MVATKGENGLVSNPRDDTNESKRGASRQDNTGQGGNVERGMRVEDRQAQGTLRSGQTFPVADSH